MQETQERKFLSLDWEDLLEEEMATHSSIFAWDIPWTEERQAIVHGVAESGTQLRMRALILGNHQVPAQGLALSLKWLDLRALELDSQSLYFHFANY